MSKTISNLFAEYSRPSRELIYLLASASCAPSAHRLNFPNPTPQHSSQPLLFHSQTPQSPRLPTCQRLSRPKHSHTTSRQTSPRLRKTTHVTSSPSPSLPSARSPRQYRGRKPRITQSPNPRRTVPASSPTPSRQCGPLRVERWRLPRSLFAAGASFLRRGRLIGLGFVRLEGGVAWRTKGIASPRSAR